MFEEAAKDMNLSHQCKQRINMLKSMKHKSGKRAKTGLRMEKQSSLPIIFYLVFEENYSMF